MCLSLPDDFCIFVCLLVTVYHRFISTWGTPFSISYRASLVVINPLSFSLSGNVLISPNFWKTVLSDVEFSDDSFLFLFLFSPYSTLNILSHCVLVCKVSAEKPSDNPLEDSLYMMSYFSLGFQGSVFVFQQFDYNVSHVGLLGFIFFGIHWISWICRFTLFLNLRNF